MKPKVIGKCSCGCGFEIIELETYRKFRLVMQPIYSHNIQVVAMLLDGESNELLKLLVETKYSDYGLLVDDNAHTWLKNESVESIVKRVKENVDKLWNDYAIIQSDMVKRLKSEL